jgi:hypothetical protein
MKPTRTEGQFSIHGEQEKRLYWDFLTSGWPAWVIYCMYNPEEKSLADMLTLT